MAAIAPGTHRVNDHLYLQIKGGRSWLHRYMFKGKIRDSGLGSVDTMTLAQARAARDDERAMIRKGVDPVAARRAERAQGAADRVKAIASAQCLPQDQDDEAKPCHPATKHSLAPVPLGTNLMPRQHLLKSVDDASAQRLPEESAWHS